jgi:hypothetical protein
MVDSTLDEARRCPTCNELGKSAGRRPLPKKKFEPPPGELHIFRCANTRCKRFDRDWIVQVRPDGTVPEPTTNREKSFPTTGGVSARERIERAQRNADHLSKIKEIRIE